METTIAMAAVVLFVVLAGLSGFTVK